MQKVANWYREKHTAKKQLKKQRKEAKKRDQELETYLTRERQEQQLNSNRIILLLGPSGSGKSTLLKQLLQIYGTEKKTEENNNTIITPYHQEIYRICLRSIQILLELTERYFSSGLSTNENQILSKHILKLSEDTKIDENIANSIFILWKDSNVQHTYKIESSDKNNNNTTTTTATSSTNEEEEELSAAPLASEDSNVTESYNKRLKKKLHCMTWCPQEIESIIFCYVRERVIPPSCEYFLTRIEEIGKSSYIPNTTDIFHSRVRSCGILENKLIIQNKKFQIIDVSGQRNERMKWIHKFQDVLAIFFVADVSEYDCPLYSDEYTNVAHESLHLFESYCNSRWFKSTPIYLFINKKDLLLTKIQQQHKSIRTVFPDYNGPETYEDSSLFMLNQFKERNKNDTKKIYTSMICSLDKMDIEKEFQKIQEDLVKEKI